MIITAADLAAMDKLQRVQLATSLPGAKPICLVGTISEDGDKNLAPFSSVTHLGSNPALLGMVTRPDTVERHTLRNILATEQWTLNHVTEEIVEQAHHCSARYPEDTSEFEVTELNPEFLENFTAPFVKESPIRIGMILEDVLDIKANNTKLIIGRVELVDLPVGALSDDGSINLPELGSLASTALDTYFSLNYLTKLPYAKPKK